MTEYEEKKTLEVQSETEKRTSEMSTDNINVAMQSRENQQTSEKRHGDADQFAGLPMESLICKPIIAAAKAQQELCEVYIDEIKKLTYKDGKEETNTLDFTYNRPIISQDGSVSTQEVTIKAPLLALVPVPTFTMDDLTVDFNMEEKSKELTSDKTREDMSSTVAYNSWFGLDASITGKVSSDTEHKSQTDSSETYSIHARAIQQPPSEGMAKLTSFLEQTMNPNSTKK